MKGFLHPSKVISIDTANFFDNMLISLEKYITSPNYPEHYPINYEEVNMIFKWMNNRHLVQLANVLCIFVFTEHVRLVC